MDRTNIPNFKLLNEYPEEINANTMADVGATAYKKKQTFPLLRPLLTERNLANNIQLPPDLPTSHPPNSTPYFYLSP